MVVRRMGVEGGMLELGIIVVVVVVVMVVVVVLDRYKVGMEEEERMGGRMGSGYHYSL
jgi:hypothetical protein